MHIAYIIVVISFLFQPTAKALDYHLRSGITYSANNVSSTSSTHAPVSPKDKVGFELGLYSTLPLSRSLHFRFGFDISLRKADYNHDSVAICFSFPPFTCIGSTSEVTLKRSTYYLDLPFLITYKMKSFEIFSGIKIPIMLFEDLEREFSTAEAPRSAIVYLASTIGVGIPVSMRWGVELFYENGITYAVDSLGVRIRSNRFGLSSRYSF